MTWPRTRASTAHKARRKALADHLAVNVAVLASARISCFLICSLALVFAIHQSQWRVNEQILTNYCVLFLTMDCRTSVHK